LWKRQTNKSSCCSHLIICVRPPPHPIEMKICQPPTHLPVLYIQMSCAGSMMFSSICCTYTHRERERSNRYICTRAGVGKPPLGCIYIPAPQSCPPVYIYLTVYNCLVIVIHGKCMAWLAFSRIAGKGVTYASNIISQPCAW
jgi:hypothetical protein